MGLDFLKYVCAFLVICIHTDFPGKPYVDALARIAVPVFFMITGFHYVDIQNRNRQNAQIKKILTITLLANLLYMVWELFSQWIASGSLTQTVLEWIVIEKWIHFVFLNESPFCSRLWYLGALLYVLVIAKLTEKAGLLRKLYFLIPILLGVNLVLGNYSVAIFGEALPLVYSRNFLFIGLPCFLLGDWLRQYRHKLKCGSVMLAVIMLVGAAVTLVEREWLERTFECYNRDFYLSTIFVAVSVFLLVNDHAQLFSHGLLSKIAAWGRDLSLGIYIYNRLVRIVMYKVIEVLTKNLPQVEAVLQALSPLLVLVATSVLVVCLNWVKKRLVKK